MPRYEADCKLRGETDWSPCYTLISSHSYEAARPLEVAEAFYTDRFGMPRNKNYQLRVTLVPEEYCFEFQAPSTSYTREVTCTE